MKIFTKKDKRTRLEKSIDKLHDEILLLDDSDEILPSKMDRLEKLYELNALVAKGKVSKDTVLIVGGNILGILLILNFEKMGIITSKGLGLIVKSRV